MSLIARFIHPGRASIPHTAHRSYYSSFFSTKPCRGAGRYFNSTKPPKPGSTSKFESAPSTTSDPSDGVSSTVSTTDANGNNKQVIKSDEQGQAPTSQTNPISPATQSLSSSSSSSSSSQSTNPPISTVYPNPTLTSKDYMLHHFFSLHRPLLLISQSRDAIFDEAPPLPSSNPLFVSPLPGETTSKSADIPPKPLGTIDDPLETSVESDTEAARQLFRTLIMNRVGGTVSWETTLSKLGIDMSQDESRVGLEDELAREWDEVMFDSTKRKRKKKMKKHKLKKRRKATRAHRLKIGR